jgi:hypothetical protein
MFWRFNMATRGVKPKPAGLRLVDGTRNVTRHGTETALREKAEISTVFGKLKRPTLLRGQARKAWDRYIAPAGWLDASREPAAIALCELWAEFIELPSRFPASKHGQLRAYMSELGLTDERNRKEAESGGVKDEFFGD